MKINKLYLLCFISSVAFGAEPSILSDEFFKPTEEEIRSYSCSAQKLRDRGVTHSRVTDEDFAMADRQAKEFMYFFTSGLGQALFDLFASPASMNLIRSKGCKDINFDADGRLGAATMECLFMYRRDMFSITEKELNKEDRDYNSGKISFLKNIYFGTRLTFLNKLFKNQEAVSTHERGLGSIETLKELGLNLGKTKVLRAMFCIFRHFVFIYESSTEASRIKRFSSLLSEAAQREVSLLVANPNYLVSECLLM